MHTCIPSQDSKDSDVHVLDGWMLGTKACLACTIHEDRLWLPLWLDWKYADKCKNLTKNGESQRYSCEYRRRRSNQQTATTMPTSPRIPLLPLCSAFFSLGGRGSGWEEEGEGGVCLQPTNFRWSFIMGSGHSRMPLWEMMMIKQDLKCRVAQGYRHSQTRSYLCSSITL